LEGGKNLMESELTLNMICDLPKSVISISKEHCDFVCQIPERVCNEHDIASIKPKLYRMFTKFNNVKFFYKVKSEDLVKVTPSYELREWSCQRSNISNQEIIVTRKVDNMIWAKKFYDTIITLSKGLTEREAIYLSYGIMGRKSNEFVAEILKIGTRSVQPIKKSCIVKTWMALETLYEDDEK